jgi:hypothetical protein
MPCPCGGAMDIYDENSFTASAADPALIVFIANFYNTASIYVSSALNSIIAKE